MTYFIIWNSDGDTTVEVIDPDKLVKDLANGDYGDNPIFLDKLPDVTDTNYWPEGSHLIIKGEIVTPRPKQVITEFALE